MSPEMIRGRTYGKGMATDVWGLGCILYELMTGTFLWELETILGASALENANFSNEISDCVD
jgi:serine/threonine protein kinase